jgi:DNA-binding transcriptional MerR regulator
MGWLLNADGADVTIGAMPLPAGNLGEQQRQQQYPETAFPSSILCPPYAHNELKPGGGIAPAKQSGQPLRANYYSGRFTGKFPTAVRAERDRSQTTITIILSFNWYTVSLSTTPLYYQIRTRGVRVFMQQTLYTIDELAEFTSVTPRTIRYYTTEGLLPPPDVRGRYALYSDEHLRRLRLIVRLKQSYLPLLAIREKLAQMSDQEVADILRQEGIEKEASATPEQPFELPQDTPETAAEYISRILSQRKHAKPRRIGRYSRIIPIEPDTPASITIPIPALVAEPSAQNIWQRIPLTEELELHVRMPLSAETQEQMKKVVALFPEAVKA